mmetsp:Transcript_33898/g.39136  ORF Transcript_33898/g.39136 Transcript_33898/m.39136 type:complete len:119 (+) Transcript_33898:972-1328(+)
MELLTDGSKKQAEFDKGKRLHCTLFVSMHGTTYSGKMLDGKLNGEGRLVNKKGNIEYRGEFENNKFEGEGVLTLPNEESFEGKFSHSFPHGQVKHTMKNGTVVKGDFYKGVRDGECTI